MVVAFITFFIIQQALIFWDSVPVSLLFTEWNRVNLLLRHQFHSIDIESGDTNFLKEVKRSTCPANTSTLLRGNLNTTR